MKTPIPAFILLLLATSCQVPEQQTDQTTDFSLKTYVKNADPEFRFSVTDTVEGEGWTSYRIRMISGSWLSEKEVEPVLWWHWLTVIVPDELRETESMMFIGGGSSHDSIPPEAERWFAGAAISTGSVISYLSNIPFQPVNYFGDRKDDRYEDDLIAFGWQQYLENRATEENRKWLARYPMTRGVVRAMDVVQEISGSWIRPVEQFFVAGASKRGWTTWTTAAADDRVIGIAPMVIDLLNIVPSFHHHWRCYGEWSPAVSDYVEHGIMDWIDTEEFASLLALVGPYSFVENLSIPKLLINATGDEFFVTDSWKFYWHDLKGDNFLEYVPNVGHGLHGSYAHPNLFSFYQAVISERNIPDIAWSIEGPSIRLEIDPAADYLISKWEVVNPETRDFRIYVTGEAWSSEPLEKTDGGSYSVEITAPETGYKAAMLEVIIDPESDFPLTFTTGTLVLPDLYPFQPFKPDPVR